MAEHVNELECVLFDAVSEWMWTPEANASESPITITIDKRCNSEHQVTQIGLSRGSGVWGEGASHIRVWRHLVVGVLSLMLAREAMGLQSLEDVRREVVSLSSLKVEEILDARSQFAHWGDAAIVHLRTLANEQHTSRTRPVARAIANATRYIGSAQAIELLADIVRGRTNVEAAFGVVQLYSESGGDLVLAKLRRSERLLRAIVEGLRSASLEAKKRIVAEVASTHIVAATPMLELLYAEGGSEIRASVSAASTVLYPYGVARHLSSLRFPRESIDSALASQVAMLPSGGWVTPAIAVVKWFDEEHYIVAYKDGYIERYDASYDIIDRQAVPWVCHEILGLPTDDDRRQLVLLVSDDEAPYGEYVVSLSDDWSVRWEHKGAGVGMTAMTPLHSSEGINGLLIASDVGSQCEILDLSGQVRSSGGTPGSVVTNRSLELASLSASSDVPGMFAYASSSDCVSVYENSGRPVAGVMVVENLFAEREGVDPWMMPAMTTTARPTVRGGGCALCPADEGGFALIAVGGRRGTADVALARYDSMLKRQWEVLSEARIADVVRVVRDGQSDLFAAPSESGQLFIFDELGTLRWRGGIPRGSDDEGLLLNDRIIKGVRAGRLIDGGMRVLVSCIGRTVVYEIH